MLRRKLKKKKRKRSSTQKRKKKPKGKINAIFAVPRFLLLLMLGVAPDALKLCALIATPLMNSVNLGIVLIKRVILKLESKMWKWEEVSQKMKLKWCQRRKELCKLSQRRKSSEIGSNKRKGRKLEEKQ
jgi:hypothetical protein